MKKILILGGGLSGLAAADKLLDTKQYEINVLESAPFLGGLASSVKIENDLIPRFNHHIVRTNTITLRYLKKYKLLGKNTWKHINLSIALNKKIYNINKPWKYFNFPYLNFMEKIRFGLFGIYISYFFNPDTLSNTLDAEKWLNKQVGNSVTKKIYYQLYGRNKFNIPLSEISAKQLAHRMKEREFNDKFTYPQYGIQGMIDGLEEDIKKKKGKIILEARIINLDLQKKKITYKQKSKNYTETFDICINTIPVPEILRFTKGLPQEYAEKMQKLRYTPVVGLLFATKKFLDKENYWINFIGERFHVLYQHSLLVDKYKHKVSWLIRYGGSEEDRQKPDEEIKQIYLAILKDYFPNMKLEWCLVFREKYAEPIYNKNYQEYAPNYKTPLPFFYNAGIEVTFPKIRNMNVAIESGEKVAKIIEQEAQ